MRIKNKRYFVYSLIGVILIGTGTAYAWHSKRLIGPDDVEARKSDRNTQDEGGNKNGETDGEEDILLDSDQSAGESQQSSDDASVVAKKVMENKYILHKDITSTFFWAGEKAGDDNKDISNLPSAWDEDWVRHFGGVDSPKKRSGYFPAGFIPKENPFYFALPYNDYDRDGKLKAEIFKLADWTRDKKLGKKQSYCKNQWAAITKNGRTTYAQWEDVGPFKENDKEYVFGSALPKSKTNNHAGIDVSPAVRDYLGLDDIDKVDWQFVDSDQVPDGPWKKMVTTSQIYWK